VVNRLRRAEAIVAAGLEQCIDAADAGGQARAQLESCSSLA
jgi:hypothetical protein